MVEGVSSCMPVALRSVGDAIRLDSENKIKEAYCQYLSCIMYISQVLKDDAWDKDLRSVYNSDIAKLFQLLHQCQERALVIISSHASSPPAYQNSQAQTAKNLSPPTEGPHRRHSDSSLPSEQHLIPQTGTHHNISNPAFARATLMTPPTDATLHLPSPPGSPRLSSNRKHFGSPTPIRKRSVNSDPLEKAYKENQQLIVAYRIRIQNHVSGGGDMTSRNLSLLRRMSENLVIAKAREEALKKKLMERQQRLQDEANRRLGPVILSTKEEQEKRLVYTKILEFEQETVWPKHLRERLKVNPGDSKLIKEIITKVFCSADHPLTQFLLDCQYHVYRKLAPLVKDVGLSSGKRDGKAVALLGELSPSQRVTTNSVENENGDEFTLISVSGAESSVEQSSSELKYEELSDAHEDGRESVSSHFSNSRLESQEDLNDMKQGNECKNISSNTDLEKLKSLLEENSQPDSAENNNTLNTDLGDHSESKKDGKLNTSSEFENYFRELEEDMLEWESSDDNDDDDNDNDGMESTEESVCDRAGKTVEERTPGDVKVEQSENGMGNPLPSFDTDKNDKVTQRGGGEHSVQLSDSAVADGKVECDQLPESKVQDSVQEPKLSDKQDFQPTDVLDPGNTTARCCIMGPCDDRKSQSVTEDSGSESREPAGGDGNKYETSSRLERKPAVRDNTEIVQNPVSPVVAKEDENERAVVTAAASEEVRSQLKNVFLDIRFFLEKLQNFLMLAYEQLDTPAGRDLCYSCVEYPFFEPLWPVLLSVLRQVNYDKEVCLADVMTENINKKPEDFGVPERLCLNDQKALNSTGNSYPYQLAVEELHRVVTFFCPLEKLECIVRTSRCICQCVEDYWEIKGKPRHSSETAIGCDDLLPILSYVIIRSGMAQLISECDAMEEFTPAGYLMGEEGYCLTTLLTALAYLATLKT